MEEMLIDPLSSYSDDETKCGFTYDEEDFSEFQVDCDFPSEEEVKREREQMFKGDQAILTGIILI
ncbi:hypothetical protein Leryth_027265 [Lithospermum erythrorhizon]|nr:hypothetical protein Leryth_027265 [Lithospermum erythrorhizon]